MISHKHKVIFIHIPKSAGSSVFKYFLPERNINWKNPDYEVLYGWCPKRRIHLQHATTKQLLETELITEEQWKTYYKFTIVRNPWDRAYSDYLWIQDDRKVYDSFYNFIYKKGKFKKILNDNSNMNYRGDHLLNQTDFFSLDNEWKVDSVLRFEELDTEMKQLTKKLNLKEKFDIHIQKSNRKFKHYSHFYTNTRMKLIKNNYHNDIIKLNYVFEDKKQGLYKIKKIF